jgi:putative membrane protein
MMYWYGGHHMGAWGWLLMILLSILFWGGLLATVAFVFARLTSGVQRGDDARQLLDERFARGEIDVDEYARRRDLLARR